MRFAIHFLLLVTAPGPVWSQSKLEQSASFTAILTFLAFLIVSLLITFGAARRTKSRSDFYVAGGRINKWQNGFAIAGDTMSAASLLGIVGLAFIVGFDMLFYLVCVVLSWGVIVLLFAERLRNLGKFTLADVLSVRLDPRSVRLMVALTSLAVLLSYLVAQLVAAGTLVEVFFGISYEKGIVAVTLLMTVYVLFGGMIATTWVQIVKAALLLVGGTILAFAVFYAFQFDLNFLLEEAVAAHPQGSRVLQPGLLFTDFISIASLTLAFLGGTAGMPHVIMRFFTVPNGQAARASAGIALTLITFFHLLVAIIGFGAIAILVDHSEFSLGGTALVGGDNMAAIHLAGELGGDLFLGFLSAVIFMTILAVVCGLTLAISATVSHDLFANVFRGGNCSERQELWINRVTLACLTVVVILLGTLLEGQNVAVLVTLSLAISASTNFPLLALAMYWRKFTTRGLVAGGLVGLIFSVGLVILSPFIWVNVLKNESAAFPYAYPTLFSMSASFIFAWVFSVTDRSVRGETERQLFDAQEFRSLLGTTTADPLR